MFIRMIKHPFVMRQVTARREDPSDLSTMFLRYPWMGKSSEEGTMTLFSNETWEEVPVWVPAKL